jgi:membrane-associated phospholipid phosphatase
MRQWSGRSLLAGSARRRAGGLLAGSAVLFIVLGVLFAGQGTADPFDRAVDTPVITWFTWHMTLALWMAYPATLVPAGGVSLVAALACLARGWLRGAVLALLAVPVASGLNDALFKHLFHRTYEGALTYPSGHTAAAAALAAALTVLLLQARPAGLKQTTATVALRWAIPAVAWLAVAVVAVGVIGLRWHYFTDTVGGVALGAGTVCGLALALDLSWPLPGLRRPQPSEASSPPSPPGSSSPPRPVPGAWPRSRSGPGT